MAMILCQPGVEVRCPHCRGWHAVESRHESGTAYTTAMLYFSCRGNTYYAGQRGHPSRHESWRSGPRAERGRRGRAGVGRLGC